MTEHPQDNFNKKKEKVIKFNDLKDHVVNCADCDRPLLSIAKIRDSEKENRIYVKCYSKKCGGTSWLHEIKGDLYFAPAKKVYQIEDMVYDEENNLMTIEIKKDTIDPSTGMPYGFYDDAPTPPEVGEMPSQEFVDWWDNKTKDMDLIKNDIGYMVLKKKGKNG